MLLSLLSTFSVPLPSPADVFNQSLFLIVQVVFVCACTVDMLHAHTIWLWCGHRMHSLAGSGSPLRVCVCSGTYSLDLLSCEMNNRGNNPVWNCPLLHPHFMVTMATPTFQF